jgi:hypothetical protein
MTKKIVRHLTIGAGIAAASLWLAVPASAAPSHESGGLIFTGNSTSGTATQPGHSLPFLKWGPTGETYDGVFTPWSQMTPQGCMALSAVTGGLANCPGHGGMVIPGH